MIEFLFFHLLGFGSSQFDFFDVTWQFKDNFVTINTKTNTVHDRIQIYFVVFTVSYESEPTDLPTWNLFSCCAYLSVENSFYIIVNFMM
jgi:hypothetical protein